MYMYRALYDEYVYTRAWASLVMATRPDRSAYCVLAGEVDDLIEVLAMRDALEAFVKGALDQWAGPNGKLGKAQQVRAGRQEGAHGGTDESAPFPGPAHQRLKRLSALERLAEKAEQCALLQQGWGVGGRSGRSSNASSEMAKRAVATSVLERFGGQPAEAWQRERLWQEVVMVQPQTALGAALLPSHVAAAAAAATTTTMTTTTVSSATRSSGLDEGARSDAAAKRERLLVDAERVLGGHAAARLKQRRIREREWGIGSREARQLGDAENYWPPPTKDGMAEATAAVTAARRGGATQAWAAERAWQDERARLERSPTLAAAHAEVQRRRALLASGRPNRLLDGRNRGKAAAGPAATLNRIEGIEGGRRWPYFERDV